MDRTTVAQARREESIGKEVAPARLGPHPPRLQGGLQLPRTQRRLLASATSRSSPTAALPNYETEIKQLTAGCSVTRRGRGPQVAGQGAGDRGQGAQGHRPRLGRSGDVSDPEEGRTVRVPAHRRPSAAADQHLRRHRPRAQLRLPLDPRFLPGAGLSLRPHADHHRQRLRRGRRDVQGHDARPGEACRSDNRQGRLTPRTSSSKPAYLTVSGQLQAEIFACALGKVYTFGPTFRAENSNTSRHLAEFWMVEPEMAFYELDDNMDLAEAFIKRIIRDVLDALRRGHGVLRTSASTRTCSTRLESIAQERLPPLSLHRGDRHPGEVGREVRVPGAVGHRPAVGARALS